jgi:glycosyltransferase involved in cell wall biosynthesis
LKINPTKQISYYGLNQYVIITGRLLRHEIERLFESARIETVPGFLDESFGMVVGEAMMRGTAVVASRVGGSAEFIQNGRSGILVPPGDENALAEALICLFRN